MYQWLSDFMTATARKMTPPTPYGAFHLTYAFVGFLICGLLAWKLRKVGEKGNRAVLLTCGIFLLVCELYKQLFYYFYIGNGSYAWHIFPFQLCSVPMYLCILAPLLKPGKLQKGMYNFMMIFNFLGGLMAFMEPSGIITGYWTLTLHAFTWHMMLVFIGLYLAFSGRAGTQTPDYWSAAKTFVVLCALAFAINVVFRDVSGGDINMFFVGPSNSSLVVFKQISEAFGWYVSTLLYIPVVCLGAYIIFSIIRLCKQPRTVKTA